MVAQETKFRQWDIRDLLNENHLRKVDALDLRIVALLLGGALRREIARELDIKLQIVTNCLQKPSVKNIIKEATARMRIDEIRRHDPIIIRRALMDDEKKIELKFRNRILQHLARCTKTIVLPGLTIKPKYSSWKLKQILEKHPITDDKYWFTHDLFILCQAIFPDVSVEPHSDVCRFIEQISEPLKLEDYLNSQMGGSSDFVFSLNPTDKLMVGFRGSLKSSILIAYAIMLGLQNPNLRILYVQNNDSNARKSIKQIKAILEKNERINAAFSSIIPSKTDRQRLYQWSAEGLCLRRSQDFKEPTYTPAGLGTNLTSQHYNVEILDDILTSKKDNLSGHEMRPGANDIEKCIGWHKVYSLGLLDRKPTHRGDPRKLHCSQRIALNNRWADNDYVDYIERNEPSFDEFVLPIYWDQDHPDEEKRGVPSWPTGPLGTMEDIHELERKQGPYIFSTQSLCKPSDPTENVFRKEWINPFFYIHTPVMLHIAAMMDLGLSIDKAACYTATVVVGVDKQGHWFILDAERGHLDTAGQLDMFFRLAEMWKPELFGMEDVLFQAKMCENVRADERYQLLSKWGTVFIPVHPYKNESKNQRIESLQPRFRNGMVHLKENQKEAYNELIRYRRKGTSICDLVDALAYIPTLLPEVEGGRAKKEIGDEPGMESLSWQELEDLFCGNDSNDFLDDVFELQSTGTDDF